MALITQEDIPECIWLYEFDSIGEYGLISLRRMVSQLFV